MMKAPNPAKISKTTCGGAEIVASIDDLLTQVFVHLPLKPLFRFKSVSKHWNSIISDPRFQFLLVKEHNNNNRAVGLIFQYYHWCLRVKTLVVSFNNDRSPSSNPPLPPQIHNIPDTLRIFHSCNGLFVLKHTDVFAKPEYYVYNPTTNQKTTNLLKDDVIRSRERDRVLGMYLAFDPYKSPHYKAVCVWLLNSHKNQYQLGVYSSETRSWDIRSGYNINIGFVDFRNGVYWNGAINWIGVYFNPDHDEMLRVMPTPPGNHMSSYFIEESCDHLHCAFFDIVGEHHFYVYEMRRDYSEWFLKYRVDYYSQYLKCVFSVVRGKDEDEDSFLVLGTKQGEIVRYNLVHNTFETIHDKASDFYGLQTSSFQYIESPCAV